jgi:hypothetical protein
MEESTKSNPASYSDLLAEIAALATQFDVFRFLKKVTELFGMRAFMVLRIPGATVQDLQSASVITNWPSELLAKYDAAGLLQKSPAVQRVRTSSIPFVYHVDAINEKRDDGKKDIVVELFQRHKMTYGAYFPVCDPGGDRGGIGFSGERPELSELEMMQLMMLCTQDRKSVV